MNKVINVACPECSAAIQVHLSSLEHGLDTRCVGCGAVVHLTSDDVLLSIDQDRGVWADGFSLCMEDGTETPPRCVKCNGPGAVRWEQTVVWQPTGMKLLGHLHPVAGIVTHVTAASARIAVFLCDEHARSRRRRILLGWLALASIVPLGFAVSALPLGLPPASLFVLLLFAGIAALFVAVNWLANAAQIVEPCRIEGGVATLLGAGPEFLASLDEE